MIPIRFGKLDLLPTGRAELAEMNSDTLVIPRYTLGPSQKLARVARVDGLHQQVAIQLKAMDAIVFSAKAEEEGNLTQLISRGTNQNLDTWEKRHEAATGMWDMANRIRQLVINALVDYPKDPDPTPGPVSPALGQARYLMHHYNYLLNGPWDPRHEKSIQGKLQKLGVPQDTLEKIRQMSHQLNQTIEGLFA